MNLPTDVRAAALARLYIRAEAQLRGLMAAAWEGGHVTTAQFYASQRAKVAAILAQLQGEAPGVIAETIGASYMHGVAATDNALGGLANLGFSGVHQEAVAILSDNLQERLGQAAVNVGRQMDDVWREQGLFESALGILRGTTREAASASLRQNFIRRGLSCFRDRGGRRWTLGQYAAMVARTTTREAVSHGTANRLLESGHDLVTISHHLFKPDVCSDFDGLTFSLSGQTEGYPTLPSYPPFHPNCRHVLTPAAATFEQFERAVNSPSARAEAERVTVPEGPAKIGNIGENFDVKPMVREKARETFDAIDRVMRWPKLSEPIPIRQIAARPFMGGGAVQRAATYYRGGWIEKIGIDRNDGEVVANLAHELGHVLDSTGKLVSLSDPSLQAPPTRRLIQRLAREELGITDTGNLEAASSAVFGAIENSRAVTAIRGAREIQLYGANRELVTRSIGASQEAFRRYLLQRDELWARAYAQYIATRSGARTLTQWLRAQQTRRAGWRWQQWDDDDFAPIAEAMDTLLEAMGLR